MGRYVQDLTDGLIQLGFRPVIFTKKIDYSLPHAGEVDFVRINCKWLPTKLRDYYYNWRLGRLRSKYGIDLMISCNRNTHSDIAICGGTHQGFCNAMGRSMGYFDRKMLRMERNFYRTSSLVVAHSEGMRRELLELYGLPESKCRTIYPPVNKSLFSVDESLPEHTESVFERKSDLYYFVIPSAGDHRVKGLDVLEDYFARTTLPIRLVLAGRKPKSLSEHIQYIGFRKDMPRVYRSADFLILGSRYEAFGLVAIESIAAGTPVVLSSSVCSGEVIEKDVKFVFDLSSFESFENAVKSAISTFGHRKIDEPMKYLHVTTSTKEHAEALLRAFRSPTSS